MPICSKCKIEKPVEAFGIERRCKTGRRYQCKACYRERYKRDRDKNLAWQKAVPLAKRMEYINKYEAKNPGKKEAWIIFRKALYHGEITRPEQCEDCGKKKPLDGHHGDYSKPLEVDWLCRACHKRKHFLENQAAANNQ